MAEALLKEPHVSSDRVPPVGTPNLAIPDLRNRDVEVVHMVGSEYREVAHWHASPHLWGSTDIALVRSYMQAQEVRARMVPALEQSYGASAFVYVHPLVHIQPALDSGQVEK